MFSIFITNIFLVILYTVTTISLIFSYVEIKKISLNNSYNYKLIRFFNFNRLMIAIAVVGLIILWAVVLMEVKFSIILFSCFFIFPINLSMGIHSLMFEFDDTTIKYINKIYYLDDIEFSLKSKYIHNKICVAAKFKKDTKVNYNFKKNRVPIFYITLRQKEYYDLSKFVVIRK